MNAQPNPVRFLTAGDTALVVEFGETVDRAISNRVLALAERLEGLTLPGVIEVVPTFRSLMIHYDPARLEASGLEAQVRPLLAGLAVVRHADRVWTLPVCFGGELGPDLDEVASRTGHSPDAVVQLLAAVTYHVYTLGFLPGYPYMGDGPEALSLPRRETPRIKVPRGSVCIAYRQAGVYSLESPGGWHLLGRTPVRLFDLRRPQPVLLAPGDKVRFEPVPRVQFDEQEARAEAGRLVVVPAESTT